MRNDTNMDCLHLAGRRYAVELLNPLEGFAWGTRALALFGPMLGKVVGDVDFDTLKGLDLETMRLADVGASVQALCASTLTSCGMVNSADVATMLTDALQRCYTPQNEPLSDVAVFNRHFRENPGDMYPLGVMALVRLVRDFFPSQLVTGLRTFQTPKPGTTATASPFPMAGNFAPESTA